MAKGPVSRLVSDATRRTRLCCLVGAVWLMGTGVVEPGILAAQTSEPTPGARIRIKTPSVVKHFYGERMEGSPWITGTLVLMERDFVRIQPEGGGGIMTVPRDSVFRMEERVAATKTPMKILGVVVGGAVGTAIGVALVYEENNYEAQQIAVLLGFFGLIAGGFGGYFLGDHVADRLAMEKWRRVKGWDQTFSLHLRPVPVERGLEASVVVGF